MELKVLKRNLFYHYRSTFIFVVLSPIIYYLFNFNFIVLLAIMLTTFLDLLSIPLLKQYWIANNNLTTEILHYKINIKSNQTGFITRHHEEISEIILHRPKANIGGMAMGEFKYFLIEYNDGMYLPITSLMFGDKINEILKLLPLDKIHEINEYYCLIKGFEKLNSTNCYQ